MNRGFTLRWRKRWDKGYHQDHLLWVMMDYFIDFANHKETNIYFPNYGAIKLKRGEHIYGLRTLAEFFNVDIGKIRRRLKILETEEFLTIRTTKRFSIAYVINYDSYQDPKWAYDTLTDKPPANHRQTTDKPPTLPNTLKECKRMIKNNYSDEFESFWKTYPKKIGKGAAYQSWLKIKPSNGTYQIILAAVAKQKRCTQWKRDSGQYIPNPATWLNQSRWEDEVEDTPDSKADKKFEEYKRMMQS